MVTFVNKNGIKKMVSTFQLNEATDSGEVEMSKIIKYAKFILT